MIDHLSPLPHVSNTRFRLAIKKYFYKDIEPEYTQQIKDLIVGDASETLDTLQELAAALDDDAEFYQTVTTKFDNLTLTVTDNELVTAAALNDLETRKQDNLESGVNVKTVNGNSLVGSGDVAIGTYRGIPSSWDTTHTMANLISSIAADTAAVPGESYMGTVYLSDLPGNMILAELIIEVMDELSGDKTVLFQLSSADTAPYKWEYVSAYGAAGVWRSWVTETQLNTKENVMSIESASGATLTAAVDKYYTMTNVGTLAITLPTMTDATKVKTIVFYISTDSAPAVTFTSTHTVLYSDGFQIDADSTYEINALWNGTAWVVAMVKIIIPSS